MPRLSFRLLFAACITLALTPACGGDDEKPRPDAGPYVPPPVPDSGPPDAGRPDAGPPLDLIPPIVESSSPAHDAKGVHPDTLVEVTFSEPMQTDRGTLQIMPGEGLPNRGVLFARPQDWDVTKTKVSFLFPDGLTRNTELTANISNFADVAGNPMRGLFTFKFEVSDGNPPRVSSAAPVEGASSVPLATSEISINFSEPMDMSVGLLVPGGGLTLAPFTWAGNQALKVPITSALVNNGLYSMRLEGFRNIHGTALDGVAYLGDGKLDFGTGPDVIAPTVTETSPREGATGVQHETIRFIALNFSEPMDDTAGKAELVDGSNPRVELGGEWSDDGFTLLLDAQHKLRPTAAHRVELTGFKDRAGNALQKTTYLGSNGALDFTMAADTVKPFVIRTNIAYGADNVYPVEVFDAGGGTAGYRKVFTFEFVEPMDPSITLVTLAEETAPGTFRSFNGAWSADRLTLTVTVTPPAAGELPLLGNRTYLLDLTRLKDRAGNLLDRTIPVLVDGKLAFYTLLNDLDLTHACTHIFTTPLAVTATASVTGATPRADQLHRLYELTLPGSNGNFSGYVRAQLMGNRSQPIFLDREVPLMVTNPASPTTGVSVTLAPVPWACTGITHVARFGTPITSELHLKYGPLGGAKFRLVLEEAF